HSHTASILLTRPTQPLIPSTTLFRSPRLEYIKKAEQHERHQNTVDLIREQPERDPHTDKFIPDDTTVVVYLEVICGLTTQPDADHKGGQHNQPVGDRRQPGKAVPHRDGCKTAPRPRGPRCSATAKTKSQQMHRVAQKSGRQQRLRVFRLLQHFVVSQTDLPK